MLKTGIIICALVACVSVANATVKLGPCKECEKSISYCFTLVASAIKGMEPVKLEKQEICDLVTVYNASTLHLAGKTCMAVGDDKAHYQTTTIGLQKIRIECKIIQLEDFAKYIGLKLPKMPKIPLLNGNAKGKEANRVIVVEWTKPKFVMTMRLDFDNDQYNVTKCDVQGENWKDLQISLKGDDLFTGLGQVLTKPVPVRAALGVVAKQIMKFAVTKVMQDPMLTEVITMLNCGDTSDIDDEEKRK